MIEFFLRDMGELGSRKPPTDRGEILDRGPLQYAPRNEMGVVFLFSAIAPKLRIRVERIQSAYPDCVAYQKTGFGEKKIRIEFEYRSSSFHAHKHDCSGCDWIVCWEHDWPNVPRGIHVMELRRYFGLGFKVWIQGVIGKDQQEWISAAKQAIWGLSKRTSSGDLLLMYYTSPACCIHDVFILTGSLQTRSAGWREGSCYAGQIRRVYRLESPIFLADLRNHRVIKTSSFVRGNMQGNLHATEYWPYLYDTIVKRNPGVRATLARYAPERLG
jgi:hypothetical protein